MKPLYNISEVNRNIDKFSNNKIRLSIEALAYIGEKFINDSRRNGSYTDRTGNLRSSIGYVIAINGKIQDEKVSGNKPTGRAEAMNFANEIVSNYNKGLVLVGFAGMEYAAYVESKGYDVISNSTPAANTLLTELRRYLGVN